MKIQFEILPPDMPNYVRFKNEPVLKQQGFKVAEGFDIKNFSEGEAKEFANFMYDTFMQHWRDRRDQGMATDSARVAYANDEFKSQVL